MSTYTRFTPIISGWPVLLLLSSIGLLLGVLISFVRPLEYSSTVRILITQELGTVDAYTASLSVERIAEDLVNVIHTSSFFEKVQTSYDIDENYFPQEETKRRKKWERSIVASVSRGSGLMTIQAYHTDPLEAEAFASAVASVLIQEGWTYTSGSNITVQLVDEPLNSRWPVRPNVLVNAFSGFVLGCIVGVAYILIQVERVRRRHQLIHEE